MKILLITAGCDRDDVSEARIAYNWVKEISRRHEVTLFTSSRPSRFGCVKDQFPDLSVIEWCDINAPNFLARFFSVAKPDYFLRFRKNRNFIKKLVEKNEFDLIHHLNPFAWRYPSPAYGLGLPLVRGPLAGGLPTPKPLLSDVCEIFHPYKWLRSTDQLRKKYDSVLNNSYRHTDCVLVAAPYVADLLKPLSIKRFEIEVELGLDAGKYNKNFKRTHSDQEIIQLLFVGRVIRTKGVRDAISAIYHMKTRQKVAFTIIGDGDDLQKCRDLVQSLQLEDVVTFRGWCNKVQVEQAYQEADIFLFPSFREPTGGVLLEAMSFGLPSVTCDYGGPAYMIADNCGLKIPPAEPEIYARLIADQLDILVANKELRQSMGERALDHALHNFNWERKMERLDAIYSSLVKS